MSLHKNIVRLAHENPGTRSVLVPMLRAAASQRDYKMYPVGTKLMFPQRHQEIPYQEPVQVIGYKHQMFTKWGPDPFIDFYVVEKVNDPGKEYVVHPMQFHNPSGWKIRSPYELAFKYLSDAMKKSGLLKDFKREAGRIKHILGFRALKSYGQPLDEVTRALAATPEVSTRGKNLVVEVPSGPSSTEVFPLQLTSMPLEGMWMVDRIDLGLG